MNTGVVLAVAAAFIVPASVYVLIVVFARRTVGDMAADWKERASALMDGLAKLEDDCTQLAADASLDDLAGIVIAHADPIDASTRTVRACERLLLRVALARLPLGFGPPPIPITVDAIRAARSDLIAARRAALAAVDRELVRSSPDPQRQLTSLPIQAGSLATGVLILVGLIWMCGFYGTLGVPFMPLLRDPEDFILIGLTAGIVPIIAFAALVALAFLKIIATRQAARRPDASALQIVWAIDTARELREPSFWFWHCILSLLLLYVTSLAGAVVANQGSPFAVSLKDPSGVLDAQVLGGVGDYVVMKSVRENVTLALPKERILCLQDAADPLSGCAPHEQETTWSFSSRDDWQTYVMKTAQCWPVRPARIRPLLSPVFVHGSAAELDARYYSTHPAYWPYERRCMESEGSKIGAELLETCVEASLRSELQDWVDNAKAGRARTPVLNFFAFASGTALPPENLQIARKRAEYMAELTKSAMHDLEHCAATTSDSEFPERIDPRCPIAMRLHVMGEMPRFPWAGAQGDPTERVVLMAACDSDVL